MTESITVCVVDDDPSVLASTIALLEAVNMKVETAASAEEFLEDYQPDKYDCILLDIRLPGMSGLELLRKLESDGQHPPVILISGHANLDSRKEGIERGAVCLLAKPYNSLALIEVIRRTTLDS